MSPVGWSLITSAMDLFMVITSFGMIFIIVQPVVVVSMGWSIEVVGSTVRCRLYHAFLSGTHVVTLIEMIRVAYYSRPPVPGVGCARLLLKHLLSGGLLDFVMTRMNETCQEHHSDHRGSSVEIGQALSGAGLHLGYLHFLTGIRLI